MKSVLDVYKRQLSHSLLQEVSETGMRDRRNPIIEVAPRISSSRKLFCVGIFPVSYTHLDVYKRQIEAFVVLS